jgi:hypothetical protein
MICALHPILFGLSNKNVMGGSCWTEGERRGVYRGWLGELRKRDHSEGWRKWKDNIKMALQNLEWGAWTGLIWLGIVTGGGLL